MSFGAQLVLAAAGAALGGGVVLALALWLVLLAVRRRLPRRYWRRAGLVLALFSIPSALLAGPLFLGYVAGDRVGTRRDEASYRGPRLDADGAWILQSRKSLSAEREGQAVDPALLAAAAERAVAFAAADGVPLRGFLVPARGTPRFAAVLAHGLFRGALEIETVGSWLRELGGDVLLLELRNHGGSGTARATFGRDEAGDVVAAAGFLRSAPRTAPLPVILFGVSLGSAAVGLAAERVPGLAGIALDAPIASMDQAAGAMLSERMGLWPPYPALCRWALECMTGVDLEQIAPAEALERLPAHVAALVIAGSADDFIPNAQAEAVFAALPALPERKELWIVPGATHGHCWVADPDGYRERLARLVEQSLTPPHPR